MILLKSECCHLLITQPLQILLYETLKKFWTFPFFVLTVAVLPPPPPASMDKLFRGWLNICTQIRDYITSNLR